MDLHLVRHAIAEEWTPDSDDPARALTPEGRAAFEVAVRGMSVLGIAFDAVWASPWRRAVETAELLAPITRTAFRDEALLAQPPAEALLRALEAAPPHGSLALVGHQPWLGELASLLAFGDAGRGLALRKGSVAWLRGEARPGFMRLEALLKPSLLRRIGVAR